MKNPLCLQDELTFELILDSKRTWCLWWYSIWWFCVRKFLPSHEWISPVMAGISYLCLSRAVLYFLVYPVFGGLRAFMSVFTCLTGPVFGHFSFFCSLWPSQFSLSSDLHCIQQLKAVVQVQWASPHKPSLPEERCCHSWNCLGIFF